MSQFPVTLDRHLIPQWRAPDDPRTKAEGLPLHEVLSALTWNLPEADPVVARWREHKSLHTATDIVSAAVIDPRTSFAQEAAQFVIDRADRVSTQALRAAWRLQSGTPEGPSLFGSSVPRMEADRIYQDISWTKQLLRRFPRDPLRWLELARLYTVLGQTEAAEGAARAAMALGGSLRIVARSVSRMLLHHGDPEAAHDLILRSPGAKADPWLLAAEISLAPLAERRPRLLGDAQRMIRRSPLGPFHLSELRAAIGRLEFESGNVRRARKLFELAALEPTDNVIAQTEWISRQGVRVAIEEGEQEFFARSAEAEAWESYRSQRWEQAFAAATRWLNDQPFAIEPAAFASHFGMLLVKHHAEVEAILQTALRANPSSFTILNNLVCIQAMRNRAADANHLLERIPRQPDGSPQAVVHTATKGLVSLRSGHVDAGDAYYREAIAIARVQGDRRLERLAGLYWIDQRLDLGLAPPQVDLSRMLTQSDELQVAVVKLLLERIASRLLSRETEPNQEVNSSEEERPAPGSM